MSQSTIHQINQIKSTNNTRVTRSQLRKKEIVKNVSNYEEYHPNQQSVQEEGMEIIGFKGKEWEYEDKSEICDEDTNTRVLAISKIKYDMDDEETKKNPVSTKNKIRSDQHILSTHKQLKAASQIQIHKQSSEDFINLQQQEPTKNQNTQKTIYKIKNNQLVTGLHTDVQANKIPQIPYNPKIESILQKKPLRQRYQSFLSEQELLPISFDHLELLKRMQYIDRTIQFMINHRCVKIVMFQTIRKTLIQSSNIYLQESTLRQLLFLDEQCYQVEWRKISENQNRYDLKISIENNGCSVDLRRMQMRKKIVKYLLTKQAQLLIKMNQTKLYKNKWHPRFEYKNITIPMKSLPVHPNQLNSDLRAFPDSEINRVQNPLLKSLLKTKKQQSQIKSLSKASVADMIFSRVPASQISQRLLTVIKQKQQRNLQTLTTYQQNQQKMENQVILKMIRQIFIIYMSKNVSNIFKVTLLEMLNKRLKVKDDFIEKCLNRIIVGNIGKESGGKIQFLKEIQSARKLKVLQINRQNYKQIQQYYQQIVKNSKQEDFET